MYRQTCVCSLYDAYVFARQNATFSLNAEKRGTSGAAEFILHWLLCQISRLQHQKQPRWTDSPVSETLSTEAALRFLTEDDQNRQWGPSLGLISNSAFYVFLMDAFGYLTEWVLKRGLKKLWSTFGISGRQASVFISQLFNDG